MKSPNLPISQSPNLPISQASNRGISQTPIQRISKSGGLKFGACLLALLTLAQFNEEFYNQNMKDVPGAVTYREMDGANKRKLGDLIDLLETELPNGGQDKTIKDGVLASIASSLRWGTSFMTYDKNIGVLLTGISQRIPVIMEAGGVQVIGGKAFDINGDGEFSNEELSEVLNDALQSIGK